MKVPHAGQTRTSFLGSFDLGLKKSAAERFILLLVTPLLAICTPTCVHEVSRAAHYDQGRTLDDFGTINLGRSDTRDCTLGLFEKVLRTAELFG